MTIQVYQIEGVIDQLREVGQLPHSFSLVSLLSAAGGVGVVKRLASSQSVDIAVGTPQLLANLIKLKRIQTNYVQGVSFGGLRMRFSSFDKYNM